MGGDVMFRVLRRTRSKGTARLVLMALCSWADSDGYAYPSLRQIARAAGCSLTSVKRAIRALSRPGGELLVHSRGHNHFDPIKHKSPPPGGFQSTNYYEILFAQPLTAQAKVISTGRAKLAPPSSDQGRAILAQKVGPNGTATPIAMQVSACQEEAEQGAVAPDVQISEGETVKLLTAIALKCIEADPAIAYADLADDVKTLAAQLPTLRGRTLTDQVRKALDSSLWLTNRANQAGRR